MYNVEWEKKHKEELSRIIYLVCHHMLVFFLYIHFRFINDGLQPITAFCDNTKIYVEMIYPSNLWILLQYFSLFEHFYNKTKNIRIKYIIITIIIIITTFFILQQEFY